MSIKGLDTILKEHDFFRGMSPAHLELIAGCGSNVVYQGGDHLCQQGDAADHFFILREGMVSIELEMPHGEVLAIQTVDAGSVLGWSWLFEPYRWSFDVRAVEPVRAIALDGRCLRGKLGDDPVLAADLMKRFCAIMTDRLEATRLQLVDMYSPPVR